MSKRQKNTAFLKTLIRQGHDGDVCAELQERIKRAERDEQCAWRAFWLVCVLAVFSALGICYSAVLLPEFFHNSSHVIVRSFFGLGMASLFCAVAFLGFWFWCRAVLNRVQEDCRRFVVAMLDSGKQDNALKFHSGRNSGIQTDEERFNPEKAPSVPQAHQGYGQLFSLRRIS